MSEQEVEKVKNEVKDDSSKEQESTPSSQAKTDDSYQPLGSYSCHLLLIFL